MIKAEDVLTIKEHSLPATVREMKRLIETYWQDLCEYGIRSIDEAFEFVKSVPYKEDKESPECNYADECVKRPLKVLIHKGGDCDDHTILLAAFMKSLNVPYRIVTVSYHPDLAQEHTYLEVKVPWVDRWVPLDATYPTNRPYNEKPFTKKIIW